MSAEHDTVTREVKVYDEAGRTLLPKDIREKMDVEAGDHVTFMYMGGTVVVNKTQGGDDDGAR